MAKMEATLHLQRRRNGMIKVVLFSQMGGKGWCPYLANNAALLYDLTHMFGLKDETAQAVIAKLEKEGDIRLEIRVREAGAYRSPAVDPG